MATAVSRWRRRTEAATPTIPTICKGSNPSPITPEKADLIVEEAKEFVENVLR
ncbi:MAG: hypothetical protein HYV03_05790 [Deltaproteobacteria bacterium]|nr:hypothetical protein [Deltaproteobacteria bacterium]